MPNRIARNSHILIYSIFPVAEISSYRLWWFWEVIHPTWEVIHLRWEVIHPKSGFSVNANPLQGISGSGLAVDKLCKTIGKDKKRGCSE